MSRVVAVFNPLSGDGRVRRRWPHVAAYLQQNGLDCRIIELGSPEWAAQLRRELAAGGDCLAVLGIGGDGTHTAVINALRELQAAHPPAVIPPYVMVACGTGNDLAKSLGIVRFGRGYLAACELIRGGRTLAMDLGQCDGHYFGDALCVGLDAAILARRIAWMAAAKGRWWGRFCRGYLLYAAAGLRELAAGPRWQATILADGKLWYEGPLAGLVINNTRIHAGEFDVTPAARIDDGRLDAALFPSVAAYVAGLACGYRYQPACLRERPRPAWVLAAREFAVHVEPPAPLQMDGELFPARRDVQVSVRPQGVVVKVPAAWSG